jgi:hypothetical protein
MKTKRIVHPNLECNVERGICTRQLRNAAQEVSPLRDVSIACSPQPVFMTIG